MTEKKYQIAIDGALNPEDLNEGLYIFMYRATRIPPHLGIINNGKLFEITLKGPNVNYPASRFVDIIKSKYTKTIFFKLSVPENEYLINETIEEKVWKYNKVSLSTSCLFPIKDFLENTYNIDVQQASFIFELLPVLKKEGLIERVFQLNMERHMNDNVIELSTYTQEEIVNCINALNRKEEVVC